MFSRLFKTPKSSLQLFRKNQAAMLPNDAESPQFPSENFSSLPIIWKVMLARANVQDVDFRIGPAGTEMGYLVEYPTRRRRRILDLE